MKDDSKDIFDRFYASGDRIVRVQLKNGTLLEGRFIGYFLGNVARGEPYIFRWHFLDRKLNVFDYDKSIDPEQGMYFAHNDIQKIEFI